MAQENYVKGCSMQRPPLLELNSFCFWNAHFETYVKSKDIDYDPNYSSKNHIRKFLCALPLNWRAKVTAIGEAKDLVDELIENLKVYEMVLDNDGVASKTTKEKVKSSALKAKLTRDQTSDDSDSQGETDECIDEEEAEAFNLLARNFRKFFRKGNQFEHDNRFGNKANRFGKGRRNNFGNKGGESSKPKGACYNCGIEGHFTSECKKPQENKAFIRGAWSDSENGDGQLNDETCLMAIDSQEGFAAALAVLITRASQRRQHDKSKQ
nr:hypothetical protein [Tanacetum cinerariifolium]GEW75708.1 hypothetical protein [Tanacetum cinerariifolium]GEW75710.1 hypothetical protein [Tanacetum cinerariifolium]